MKNFSSALDIPDIWTLTFLTNIDTESAKDL